MFPVVENRSILRPYKRTICKFQRLSPNWSGLCGAEDDRNHQSTPTHYAGNYVRRTRNTWIRNTPFCSLSTSSKQVAKPLKTLQLTQLLKQVGCSHSIVELRFLGRLSTQLTTWRGLWHYFSEVLVVGAVRSFFDASTVRHCYSFSHSQRLCYGLDPSH